jgi:hypothetical protein
MRRSIAIAVLCGWACQAAHPVLANTWCSSNFPNAVVCDDFDRYCANPPPEPQECTTGWDGDSFYSVWKPNGPCSSPLGLDSAFAVSSPWGAKTNTQENSTLGFAIRTFSDSVRRHFGLAYSSVQGTDLNPLVLEFVMNGQSGKAKYDNSFLSFGSNYATAPTDWTYSDWCMSCGSPDPRYPIICQQETQLATCPSVAQAAHVPAIAAGFVAYLDTNPCHCSESGNRSPYNEHLAFFDGHKWYRLRQGLFPGSGDFIVRSQHNQIRITIRLTTMKVELTTPATGEYSWCEMPRDYPGGFNSFTLGYPVACRVKSGSWECQSDPSDPLCMVGVPGGGVPYYDNIAVYGGIPSEATGACCFPNTSCTQDYPGDCRTRGGTPAGPETTCPEVPCCPPLPVDHDMDGDVDIEDFGWLQTCLSAGKYVPPPTVPCRCADLDGDTDVDIDDVGRFTGCMLGPGVQADPNCHH